MRSPHSLFVGATLVFIVGACSATHRVPAAEPRTTAPAADAADVRFIQRMLAHHVQALAMAELVDARTPSRDLRLLAERIAVSQRDEMEMMREWLRAAGQPLAAPGHEGHHDPDMPGMASETQMARLASATGDEFDAIFLELMIRHHEGALVMVAELFDSGSGAQRADVYRIASEVDADQRAEILRMRAMLRARS